MNKIVVFDFDKTLTIKDTNLNFFKFIGKQKPFFITRLWLYYICLILRKIRLISNIKLKNLGYYLFLKKISKKEFLLQCNNYAYKIELNNTLKNLLSDHNKNGDRVLITTASLSSYVKPLFPKIEVVGSELDFSKSPLMLSIHCYKTKKVECLKNLGINQIDVLYTDSISDLPVAQMAKKINLVKKNMVIQCNSIEEFVTALSR